MHFCSLTPFTVCHHFDALLLQQYIQELAKGQMLGGVDGFLKLIFDTRTLKLLGVHCFGEGATEIIHIGQVLH
jgi:pyruvate/2-oxoglutarate dehydrogenase complex dihydrolipoamide dehydrogenase (E3) component